LNRQGSRLKIKDQRSKIKDQRSKIKNTNQKHQNGKNMAEGEVKQEFKNRIYNFSVAVIRFVHSIPQERRIHYALSDQLLRASTSVGANIVEAKASSSKKNLPVISRLH